MNQTSIYQELLKFSELRDLVQGSPVLQKILSGLISKFEPINSINGNTRNQETAGFELLLAHRDGIGFWGLLNNLQASGLSEKEASLALDMASLLVHFHSIHEFNSGFAASLPRDFFFSLNITREMIKMGEETTAFLMDKLNRLPVSRVYLELHEKIGFKDREAANKHLIRSKRNYLLDDVFAEAGPGHYMEYLPEERVHGFKYDHERFWDEYGKMTKGIENKLPSHLKEMFSFSNKIVIIEGVKDSSYLDFIFHEEAVVRGRSLFIQGEFAGIDKKYRAVLNDFPHPFGFMLKGGSPAAKNGLARTPQIPASYRNWLNEHCRYMDLKKLMDKGKAVQVELPEVFIPLYSDPLAKLKGKKEEERAMDMEMKMEKGERKPVDIEDMLKDHDVLLIEGQAGSGKTTLLKHIAFSVINNSFGRGMEEFLPVLVYLKDLQNIEKKGDERITDEALVERFLATYKIQGAVTAENFLSAYFKALGNGLDMETVREYCRDGKVLFLFDGLDEMDPRAREATVNSLSDFRSSFEKCGMVFSGRPHGLDETVVKRFGKNHATVRPLDMDQVTEFVNKWFGFIFSKGTALGRKTASEMLGEIKAHQNMGELIHNPLMLTAICILYYDDRKLPEQRAELYKKFTDNLIHRRFDDPDEVLDFLMETAFLVHASNKRGFDRSLALETVKSVYRSAPGEEEETYRKRMEKKFGEIEQNCGLLKLEGGQFGFWHLTFQEFLAARFIATKKSDYIKEIEQYWKDDWYREFIELMIGFLSIDSKGWANKIVLNALTGEDESPFKKWRLAANSLLDMHKSAREPDVLKKAHDRLQFVFQLEKDLKIRAEAGEILGWLGDPRPDLEEFVKIEGGDYDLEELGKANLKLFEIGKYPVTNQWFGKFIQAGGYKEENWERYWTQEGRKWMKKKRHQVPCYWHERQWNCPNAPVVGVSWWEADAFCRWLTEEKKDGFVYRLPKDQEWQAAAAGKKGREYPWGSWEKGRCNTKESGIGKTSAVGIFANGNTPEGVADMSGNVWEWIRSDYDSKLAKEDFTSDKWETSLRGGSWFSDQDLAGCAFRSRRGPSVRINVIGFRCARTLK